MDKTKDIKYQIIAHCRKCRKSHGYTLKDLEDRTGINYTVLSVFESGRFSFDKARAYYLNSMRPIEQKQFEQLIDDLKAAYLNSGK